MTVPVSVYHNVGVFQHPDYTPVPGLRSDTLADWNPQWRPAFAAYLFRDGGSHHPDDPLRHVCDLTVDGAIGSFDDARAVAEKVWMFCQNDHPSAAPEYVAARVRSLCIGDVVVLAGELALRVDDVGFSATTIHPSAIPPTAR